MHDRLYKLIMDLIPNNWKQIATSTWNFPKTIF